MSIEVKFRSAGLCAGSTYVIQGPGVADWSDIENGPASSPEDIDAAVAAAHTHTNSAMLAKIGESAGEPTYDGEQLAKTSALTTKADLVAGKVPADQLPSYVDDVLEYANAAAFPASGSSGVIYIAVAAEKAYRWTGSTYVEISQPPASSDAVPEGSSNLYYTQARADARAEAAVAVHVGQSDPHTQYLTTSRGDARYDALGAAADAQAACPAETATTIGALISGATAKTAPADADTLGLSDSAASNVLKKLTWANAKATLKTYFDSLYQAAGSYITSGGALGTPASGNLSNCSGAVDARIPTSGNTAGNVPAFTSTGGQLGASPISVAGSSIVINSDGNAAFVFRGITNPNNNIYVGYDSAGNYGRIQAITEGTALRPLALNPDGGNVGIGTTSPGAKLHIESANVQPSLRIEDSRLLAQGLGGELYLAGRYGSSRGSGEGVYTRIAAYKENATNEDYAYAMTFSTHPFPGSLTEGMRISSAGNVGIGTTSPAYPLDVNGAARAQGFAIGSVSSVAYGTFQLYSTANKIRLTYPNVADFDMSLNSAGQFSMLGGNVGIGTTSPTDLLDVNSDAMRLRSSKTPASASAAGNAGEMCWDADFLYVCVSTNQWKRAALSTW